MKHLPPAYFWLSTLDPLPKMVAAALDLYGTLEAPGAENNPAILAWARELGGDVARDYRSDGIAWCGLFMAIVAKRAGKQVPLNPLWALNWAQFGEPADRPKLGDVLTFKRNGGGHVGLYVGEDPIAYHVLGGNQSDRVCFTRIARTRLFRARRPTYSATPATVKKYALAGSGDLSSNEA